MPRNKNVILIHTNSMPAAMVILSVNIVLLLLFTPLKIGVKCHFSLSRLQALVTVSVLGFSPLRIKVEKSDGKFRVRVNGKKPARRRRGGKNIPAVIDFLRRERLLSLVNAAGIIGGEDAMDAAMTLGSIKVFLSSLIPALNGKKSEASILLKPDFDSDRLDFELNAGLKINAVQALRLAVLVNTSPAK